MTYPAEKGVNQLWAPGRLGAGEVVCCVCGCGCGFGCGYVGVWVWVYVIHVRKPG